MADIDLDSLRAVMAQRTPGEWAVDHYYSEIHDGGGFRIAILAKRDDCAAIVAAVNAIGPLLERVEELEVQLAAAADHLACVHPIGEVKAIGLMEVAKATGEVCNQLAAANERIAGLEAQCEGLSNEALAYQSMANRRGEIIEALDGKVG